MLSPTTHKDPTKAENEARAAPDEWLDSLQLRVDESAFRPTPAWARYLIRLGEDLEKRASGLQIVTVVSLPVRAYAAVFLAFGLVCAKLRRGNAGSEQESQAHLKRLQELPSGQPVTLFRKDRKIEGVFEGTRQAYGQMVLVVRVQSRIAGNGKYVIPARESLDIMPVERDSTELKDKIKSRQLRTREALLNALVGRQAAMTHFRTAFLDCVICGSVSALENELKRTGVAVSNGKTPPAGSMLDVVRAKRFLPAGDAFNADVWPPSSLRPRHRMVPPAYWILDGAAAFLHRRQSIHEGNIAVILDRTDPRAVDVAEIIKAEYLGRRDDYPVYSVCEAAGIEVMAYQL